MLNTGFEDNGKNGLCFWFDDNIRFVTFTKCHILIYQIEMAIERRAESNQRAV